MSGKPNSGAEILDNLQGVMSDAQMGRGDLTYIGAPKSIKRERDLSAYTAVADLIAERDALRAALIEVRDNAKDDSPDMWGRVELALAFATTAKYMAASKAFEAAVVEMARPGRQAVTLTMPADLAAALETHNAAVSAAYAYAARTSGGWDGAFWLALRADVDAARDAMDDIIMDYLVPQVADDSPPPRGMTGAELIQALQAGKL